MLKLHFASNSPGGVSCIEVGRMSRPSFSLRGKDVTCLDISAHARALLLGGYFQLQV